jgi:transcriptional regulator with GAF, ATPase, and Fis domain
MGKGIAPLDADQLRLLRDYHWPGNVRELQNVIERAIILASGSRLQLERALSGTGTSQPAELPRPQTGTERILTAAALLELERANLIRALAASDWKVSGENGARLLSPPTRLPRA